MITITSLQHPLVKHLVGIKESSSYRKKYGTALVTGKKMVSEIAHSGIIKTLFVVNDDDCIDGIENVVKVTPEIIKKVSGVRNPESIAAEVMLPEYGIDSSMKFFVVLENVSDPGNMGTIIRTALAFCWDALILVGDCVDPYNDKALRSAKGATFRIPIVRKSWDDLKALLEERHIPLYVADMRGTDVACVQRLDKAAVLFASEAHGASEDVKRYGIPLAIPISHDMESLNVAVAGGIILYTLKERVL